MAASTLSLCSSDLSYGSRVCLPGASDSCPDSSWQGEDCPESCEPACCAPVCCTPVCCAPVCCKPVCCTPVCCKPVCCTPVCCKPVCCTPVCCTPVCCKPVCCEDSPCTTSSCCQPSCCTSSPCQGACCTPVCSSHKWDRISLGLVSSACPVLVRLAPSRRNNTPPVVGPHLLVHPPAHRPAVSLHLRSCEKGRCEGARPSASLSPCSQFFQHLPRRITGSHGDSPAAFMKKRHAHS
uniref:Uncharacterized protein n=1 Tax=Suricata suricatta TaxID=37032 RepID=A0A673SXZ0_SURSU